MAINIVTLFSSRWAGAHLFRFSPEYFGRNETLNIRRLTGELYFMFATSRSARTAAGLIANRRERPIITDRSNISCNYKGILITHRFKISNENTTKRY